MRDRRETLGYVSRVNFGKCSLNFYFFHSLTPTESSQCSSMRSFLFGYNKVENKFYSFSTQRLTRNFFMHIFYLHSH